MEGERGESEPRGQPKWSRLRGKKKTRRKVKRKGRVPQFGSESVQSHVSCIDTPNPLNARHLQLLMGRYTGLVGKKIMVYSGYRGLGSGSFSANRETKVLDVPNDQSQEGPMCSIGCGRRLIRNFQRGTAVWYVGQHFISQGPSTSGKTLTRPLSRRLAGGRGGSPFESLAAFVPFAIFKALASRATSMGWGRGYGSTSGFSGGL